MVESIVVDLEVDGGCTWLCRVVGELESGLAGWLVQSRVG